MSFYPIRSEKLVQVVAVKCRPMLVSISAMNAFLNAVLAADLSGPMIVGKMIAVTVVGADGMMTARAAVGKATTGISPLNQKVMDLNLLSLEKLADMV